MRDPGGADRVDPRTSEPHGRTCRGATERVQPRIRRASLFSAESGSVLRRRLLLVHGG